MYYLGTFSRLCKMLFVTEDLFGVIFCIYFTKKVAELVLEKLILFGNGMS